MSAPATQRKSIRFCGRSFLAFVLTPEPPIYAWLANLDEWSSQFAGYFAGKPVVLDVSAVKLSNGAIVQLIDELQRRNIRIMGLEGIEQSELGPDLPPVLKGGRTVTVADQPMAAPPDPQPPQKEPASLLLESPVRSGQSIVFPDGDITVLGSVASGAEIWPVARFTFMAHFAAAPSPVWRETPGRASSATKSKPSCSPSTAITALRTKSNRACAANPYRLG